MNDCLKYLESDISLPNFIAQLEVGATRVYDSQNLSTLIPEDPVEIDKTVAKNLLTAFMNHWRFASKMDALLLEGFFSILSSSKFFTAVEKPFLKLLLTNAKNSSAKWQDVVVLSHVKGIQIVQNVLHSVPGE